MILILKLNLKCQNIHNNLSSSWMTLSPPLPASSGPIRIRNSKINKKMAPFYFLYARARENGEGETSRSFPNISDSILVEKKNKNGESTENLCRSQLRDLNCLFSRPVASVPDKKKSLSLSQVLDFLFYYFLIDKGQVSPGILFLPYLLLIIIIIIHPLIIKKKKKTLA